MERFGDARGRRARGVVVITALAALVFSGPASGADTGDSKALDGLTYRGVAIQPLDDLYVVSQDVNAREKPANDAPRRELLERGDKVRAFGRAGAGWVAVRRDGEDAGFVPLSALRRVFDGELTSDLRGRATLPDGRACEYIIHYAGSSPVEGEIFETADYEVGWRCATGGGAAVVEFSAFLFVTEATDTRRKVTPFQVTMDIWELGGGADDQVFSTTMMYFEAEGRIEYDGVSVARYAGEPPKPRTARAVPEVLGAAVEMAVASWNENAWDAIRALVR